AGNNNQENPKRATFQELIFVCSTIADNQKNDVRSSFSNFGVLIHVCSPGGDGAAGILATQPKNQYQRMSGTSMATPNAAAVAALIWAKNPKWTRDQVVAQLLGTADNIEAKNPGFEGKLGTGRTNSVDALSKAPRKARFVGVFNRLPNGNLKDTSQITLLVQGIIAPVSSNDLRHYRVVSAGADGQFGTADDQVVPAKLAREVLYASRAISLKFDSNLKVGKYKVQVNGAKMADPFDQALDPFEQEFAVAADGGGESESNGRWW
ncbi:MAG: S8 family serine peptidase, partial [Bdellovibrionales bacterium]|nr:S8 family serine peptidase [Bdellovibrionales bacterium]